MWPSKGIMQEWDAEDRETIKEAYNRVAESWTHMLKTYYVRNSHLKISITLLSSVTSLSNTVFFK